jgi:hypothetical protein
VACLHPDLEGNKSSSYFVLGLWRPQRYLPWCNELHLEMEQSEEKSIQKGALTRRVHNLTSCSSFPSTRNFFPCTPWSPFFFNFNFFIIHMCIQCLDHFSSLPPPPPLPPTPSPPPLDLLISSSALLPKSSPTLTTHTWSAPLPGPTHGT